MLSASVKELSLKCVFVFVLGFIVYLWIRKGIIVVGIEFSHKLSGKKNHLTKILVWKLPFQFSEFEFAFVETEKNNTTAKQQKVECMRVEIEDISRKCSNLVEN